MDYRLVDEVTDPAPEADALATEKLVRLAGGFLAYRPDADAPDIAPPPCLDNGFVTFGSFNNLAKLSEATLETWIGILRAVPGSRLLLKTKVFDDPGVVDWWSGRFTEHGIDRGRIDLLPSIPSLAGHLAAYHRVDIALDTFPYNGTTTTCEALWMGVPVLTLAGDCHAARVGTSLLTRLGLEDWIAGSRDDYVRRAGDWASRTEDLATLRAGMRERMRRSPLLDGRRLAREIEAFYLDSVRRCREAGNGSG